MVTAFLKFIGEQIFAPILEPLIGFMFQVSYLETEGVFPFGRPVSPGLGPETASFSTGLLPALAARAYDIVWLNGGSGEITIFALLLFGILTAIGGFAQMFKWYPTESFDPLVGVPIIIFWYPIGYGFVALVHRLTLAIPLDVTALSAFMIESIVNGYALPYGVLFLKIGTLVYLVIAFIMWIRIFGIVIYLVFGPVMLAIIFANLPGFSQAMKDVMKISLPLALIPLPFTLVIWVFQITFISGGEEIIQFLGLWSGGWYIAGNAIMLLAGAFMFMLMSLAGAYSIVLTFQYKDAMLSTADDTLRKTAGAAGVYAATGDTQAAAKALRSGPTRGAKTAMQDDMNK